MGSNVADAPLTTSWQRVSVALPAAAPRTSTLDLNAYVSKAAPGTCAYLDDALLELG